MQRLVGGRGELRVGLGIGHNRTKHLQESDG